LNAEKKKGYHGRVNLEELGSVRFPVTLPSFSHLLYPRRRRVCSNRTKRKMNSNSKETWREEREGLPIPM